MKYEPNILNPTDRVEIHNKTALLSIPSIESTSPTAINGRFAIIQNNYSPAISSYRDFATPPQKNHHKNYDTINSKPDLGSPKSKLRKFKIFDEGSKSTIFESKEKKGNSLIENDIFNRSVGNVLKKINLNTKNSSAPKKDRNSCTSLPEIPNIPNEIAKSTSILSQIKEYEADSAYKVAISKPGRIFTKDMPERLRLDNTDSNLNYDLKKLPGQKFGRFISYDYILFNNLPLESKDVDDFKYACLVNKGALYDSNILQIGMIGSLNPANLSNDKTFKLTLHYGNKTDDEISNFTVFPKSIIRNSFLFGSLNAFFIALKNYTEVSNDIIAPKVQIKQEFQVNFSEYSNNNLVSINITYR